MCSSYDRKSLAGDSNTEISESFMDIFLYQDEVQSLGKETYFFKNALHLFFFQHLLVLMFSCEFCEIFQNTFFYRIPPVAASEYTLSGIFNFLFKRSIESAGGEGVL